MPRGYFVDEGPPPVSGVIRLAANAVNTSGGIAAAPVTQGPGGQGTTVQRVARTVAAMPQTRRATRPASRRIIW